MRSERARIGDGDIWIIIIIIIIIIMGTGEKADGAWS